MASSVSNGNDRSEKWQLPFQMATTVYEREISGAALPIFNTYTPAVVENRTFVREIRVSKPRWDQYSGT